MTIQRNEDGTLKTIDGVNVNEVTSSYNNVDFSTRFPTATSDPLKIDAKRIVADVAHLAGLDNWDGVIRDNPIDLGDIGGPVVGTLKDLEAGNLINDNNEKQYPFNPANYASTGDPRLTTDKALMIIFDHFTPRQKLYAEIVNAGGCKIVNGYICNAEGIPVQQASANCPVDANLERITPQEIKDFVNNLYATTFAKQSDAFVNEIKNDYLNKGWTLELTDMIFVSKFIAKLSKPGSDNIYIKYFYDQKEYVSKAFNMPLKVVDLGEEYLAPTENGANFIKALKISAPVYNI
jgi:hypothetical protein